MNKDRTVLSSADNRLSMLAMLQELPRNVNDFNPIRFSAGTGAIKVKKTFSLDFREQTICMAFKNQHKYES